jgi:hypothetical protein
MPTNLLPTANYEIHFTYDDDSSEVLHRVRITLTEAVSCLVAELQVTLLEGHFKMPLKTPYLSSISLCLDRKTLIELKVATDLLVP